MQIGDRLIVCDPKHPFCDFTGTLIGFRGKRSPDDVWLLILIDNRGRSYLIPQSMVKALSPESSGDRKVDPYADQSGYN
ncbi:MAG: hypothetical protein NTV45_06445 [Firmicutes bacterium]|nr:hypothetical protein [Bacillota bacterium]